MAFLFLIFFWRQVWKLFLGSWFYFFSAFLLLCFSVLFFRLFLLLCFPCFSVFLLLWFTCFSAFPAPLLLCLCASLLLLFYFFCSSVMCFAALLPASLLLCFLSLLPLCVFFSFALSLLFVNTLGETQRNFKEILIRTPDKKPYMKSYMNPKETTKWTLKIP